MEIRITHAVPAEGPRSGPVTVGENGVTIDLTEHGGGTIRLEGFDIANLSADDFLFRVNQTIDGDESDNVLRRLTYIPAICINLLDNTCS